MKLGQIYGRSRLFDVTKNGKPYAEIIPERRYYDVRTMTMSEVGLDGGFGRFIYCDGRFSWQRGIYFPLTL